MSITRLAFAFYSFLIWSTLVGFNILAGELDITDLSETGQGVFIKQISFILIFFFAVFLTLINQKINTSFFKNKVIVGLLILFLFCLLTIYNSYVPDVSFRRLIVTFIVLGSLLLFSLFYETKLLLDNTSVVIFIFIVISILACLTIPEAIHSSDAIDQQLVGSWKGIFTHKNVAGAVAAVSVFLFLNGYGFKSQKINKIFAFVSFIFLIMTASKTSIILVVVIVLFSRPRFLSYAIRNIHYVFAVCLMFSPLIYLGLVYTQALINNPESFTGRSSIWQILFQIIYDNPYIGAGFQSLYHVGPYSKLTEYAGDWVQFVAHGHNGYIDLTAQIGVLGVLLFIVVIIKPIFVYLKMSLEKKTTECVCIFSIFSFFLAHNFTESSFLDTTRVGWFFIGLCFSVAVKESFNAGKRNNS